MVRTSKKFLAKKPKSAAYSVTYKQGKIKLEKITVLKSNCTFREDKKDICLTGGTEVYNKEKLCLFDRFISGMEDFK